VGCYFESSGIKERREKKRSKIVKEGGKYLIGLSGVMTLVIIIRG